MKSIRFEFIDFIRAFAAMQVILLHTRGAYLESLAEKAMIDTVSWDIVNLLGAFCRLCVPLFFMIGGFLFFSKRDKTVKQIISTRIPRLLIPLIVYSLIYMAYSFLLFDVTPKWYMIFRGYDHLWFLPIMIIVTMISLFIRPVLRDDNASFKYTGLIIFILFLSISIMYNFPCKTDASNFVFHVIIANVFYFLLGYYLGKMKLKIKPVFPFILYVLISFFIGFLNKNFALIEGQNIMYFSEFSSPLIIVQAVLVFLMFKNICYTQISVKLKYLIGIIAKYSFGIYCIHYLFVDIFHAIFKAAATNFLMVVQIVIIFMVSLAFSLVISVFIRKFDKKGYFS